MKTIFLIGVSGSGKTTVGLELSKIIGRGFKDGDDFHSVSNKEKMSSGIPLTDIDRKPWLLSINSYCRSNPGTIIACSALKAAYRTILRFELDCVFINLCVNRKILEDRLKRRISHFMPVELLNSQIATWEKPTDENDVFDVDYSTKSVFHICDEILQML